MHKLIKPFLAILLTTNILYSSGLEGFLTTSNNDIGDIKKKKYYRVDLERTSYKKSSVSSKNAKAFQEGLDYANNMRQKSTQHYQNETDRLKQSIRTKRIEVIVLKYLDFPDILKKHNIDENVSVAFDIDKKGNIDNIVFEEKSNYEDLNKEIKEAILKSAIELEAPKVKTTKKLFYHFSIKV